MIYLLISILCLVTFTTLLGLFLAYQFTQFKIQSHSLSQHSQQLEQRLRQELRQNREESQRGSASLQDLVLKTLTNMSSVQNKQLEVVTNQLNAVMQANEKRIQELRESVEKRLTLLQQDNNQKLEQMRATVDEKLHATLEKRLGDSFKLVSDKLDQVHKGFGEMQSLAAGVGDLKKVLTNVKTKGTWGEVQCENLLEQILTKEQYKKQVAVKPNSQHRVDFAIKLPGKSEDPVYVPIDSKFPLETYQLIIDAQQSANSDLVKDYTKDLERQLLAEAKQIHEKYIHPPYTTDFAIMYLPIEGLYAQVLQTTAIQNKLQEKYRVVISGPTTLAALLNSLQMGFKTVAIEKRSSEVWSILATVKSEFVKFGDILDKTKKKLQEAGNTIDTASQKSRTIERKLKNVESLPEESIA
ncbi:DNA recombination protein RmuC, partial [bacterium]|nr:DNA recombination protein RmuC [bacterium]